MLEMKGGMMSGWRKNIVRYNSWFDPVTVLSGGNIPISTPYPWNRSRFGLSHRIWPNRTGPYSEENLPIRV